MPSGFYPHTFIATESNLGYNTLFWAEMPENSRKNTEFTEQKAGFAHLITGSETF
jgi:hypothetical protein